MIHLRDVYRRNVVQIGLCGEKGCCTMNPAQTTCEECKKCYDLIVMLSNKLMDKETE